MRNVSAFLICLSGSLQVAAFSFAPEKQKPAAALGCCGCVHCQLGSDRKEHQNSGVPVTDNPCINGVLPKQKKPIGRLARLAFCLLIFPL